PGSTCALVGSYTVSQADVDAGQVVNTGTAGPDETPPQTTPPVVTEIDQNPSLSLVKVLSDAPTPIVLGSVLEYTVTATNDGNVTLYNVAAGAGLYAPSLHDALPISPGSTCALVGSYTVSQADVDAGQV